jgi:hypothetical protein
MIKIFAFVNILILNVVASCSSVKVQTDYDSSVHFSDLHSYQWLQAAADLPRPEYEKVDTELLSNSIHQSADEMLKSREYLLVQDQVSDFYLTYYAGIKGNLNVNDYGYSYGANYGGFYDRNVNFQGYQEGILIIDVIRTDNMDLIWRGWATGVIEDPARVGQKVDAAVQKILEKFPPDIRK